MKKAWLVLAASLLFATLASSYRIDGLFPNCGPTTGETRLTIYSSSFLGMNYTDHPNPQCRFPNAEPQPATWIHCSGSEDPDTGIRNQTCLNCQTLPHDVGTIKVEVSINGDFKDTATADFTFYTQPTLTFANPFLGYKTGGTFIQVNGENFSNLPTLTCSFGSVVVPATYVSSSLVTCTSPPSDVVDSSIPLRVSQNNQQLTPTEINYFYHAVPEISALVPNEGSISGGTEVYIRGKQMNPFLDADISYENTTFAKFGQDQYVRLELINKTHAKAIAPPVASAVPVTVEITFNNQEWTNNHQIFNYFISPYITNIIPNFGILTGGTNVTLIGANIHPSEEIKCRFGDQVVDGHYISETSVWCITPAQTSVGPYGVSLSVEKNHYSGSNVKFLYIERPTVSAIQPSCGPTTGGTQIAVVGTNFVNIDGEVYCVFGDDIHQPATVINSTLLYCDTPRVLNAHGENVNNVSTLTFGLSLNQAESITSSLSFNYYTMPLIFSISPKIGPLEGGTTVLVEGSDFSNSCQITCRFATIEVQGTLTSDGNIQCTSPAVPCSGDSLVQVSLNGKQYSQNTYENQDTVFTNYRLPVVAYALPVTFPTYGGSSLGVYGSQFLLSKPSASLTSGAQKVTYLCRFKDASNNKVLGTGESTYFTDSYVHCRTPQISSPNSNVVIEISPNGQSWIPVPNQKFNFYSSAEVTSVEPSFGKIRQVGTTLNVKGKYLDCPDSTCQNLKCSFSGENYTILTDGVRKSSTLVVCQIPSLSRPDETQVQVTMNGVDFTPQNVTYTFYDAFVVNLDPAYIPIEGNVLTKVQGFGFANSPQLKVRLENSADRTVLTCGSSSCVFSAQYISPTEISFTAPAQSTIKLADGTSIGDNPIYVEASVYNDEFTDNRVELNFYQQPAVGASLTSSGTGKYEFHANAVSTLFIPISLQMQEGIKQNEFLRKTRVLCKFTINKQDTITEGKFVQYPYPIQGVFDLSYLNVQCPTPIPSSAGSGTVSLALNGQSYVGNLPITVLPQLQVSVIQPRCGPREGGTNINMNLAGIQDDEYGNLYFSWSGVCTDPLTADLFAKPGQLTTITPPSPYDETSGGFSLVAFTARDKSSFQDNSTLDTIRNHFESSLDFLYYRRPVITRIQPHGGIYTGGTPVIVEGAFFFSQPSYGCTPKCKFGDQYVEAEFLSALRIRCIAPAGTLGSFVPLTVSMNGQDVADSADNQTFAYINRPSISRITPTAGPSTGGTMLVIEGEGFVDLSAYPEEFACSFTPIDSSEPTKVTPASFMNSNQIACSTPGGWNAGTKTQVAFSLNGIDWSTNDVKFRFYQISKIFPLSGPSNGESLVTISGSGLLPDVQVGPAACRINNIVVNATVATSETIQCRVPAATQGDQFHGNVDFYYTLDGERWEPVIQGFTYYQQPEVDQVIPSYIASTGGTLKVKGSHFRANFYGAEPTCRLNNAYAPVEFISDTEIRCPFEAVEFNPDQGLYLQVALNNASFTEKAEVLKVNVYQVSSIKPLSGPKEGGTPVREFFMNY